METDILYMQLNNDFVKPFRFVKQEIEKDDKTTYWLDTIKKLKMIVSMRELSIPEDIYCVYKRNIQIYPTLKKISFHQKVVEIEEGSFLEYQLNQ